MIPIPFYILVSFFVLYERIWGIVSILVHIIISKEVLVSSVNFFWHVRFMNSSRTKLVIPDRIWFDEDHLSGHEKWSSFSILLPCTLSYHWFSTKEGIRKISKMSTLFFCNSIREFDSRWEIGLKLITAFQIVFMFLATFKFTMHKLRYISTNIG